MAQVRIAQSWLYEHTEHCSSSHKWGQFPLWAIVDICLSCLWFAFRMRESSVRTRRTCLCPVGAVCCTWWSRTFCIHVTEYDPSGEFQGQCGKIQEHLSSTRTGCIQQCHRVDSGLMNGFKVNVSAICAGARLVKIPDVCCCVLQHYTDGSDLLTRPSLKKLSIWRNYWEIYQNCYLTVWEAGVLWVSSFVLFL